MEFTVTIIERHPHTASTSEWNVTVHTNNDTILEVTDFYDRTTKLIGNDPATGEDALRAVLSHVTAARTGAI